MNCKLWIISHSSQRRMHGLCAYLHMKLWCFMYCSPFLFIIQSLVVFFSHFLFPCFPFISTKNWTQCFPHGTELCCGDSSLFVISYLPRPYPLLRASRKFRGKLLALNPRLLCIFHPWDTFPQHPFYLEVIESSVCCPGGRKLLLEVRVALEWYLRVWMGTLWLKVLLSESPRPPASC